MGFRFERAVGGAVVGTLSVVIIGEAWHAPVEDGRAPYPPLVAYVAPHSPDWGGPQDEDGHREATGRVMLRYATIVTSTSGVNALTAAVSDDRDLRRLAVPVTLTSSGWAFGQEYWMPRV